MTASFSSTTLLAMSSTRRSSSAVIGFVMHEVETQAIRRHQRTALGDMIAEHLTQRFMQQMGRRVIGANRRATGAIDVERQRSADFQRALLERADMHEQIACALLGFGDTEGHALAGDHTGIADLATGLCIERRLVEHDGAGVACLEAVDFLAVLHQCRNRTFCRARSRSRGIPSRRVFHVARTRSLLGRGLAGGKARRTAPSAFCFSIASVKDAISTEMPRLRSASCVRSSGKP